MNYKRKTIGAVYTVIIIVSDINLHHNCDNDVRK